MNKYAFFDFDGTLYKGFSINDFIIFLAFKLGKPHAGKEIKLIVNSFKERKITYHEATILVHALLAGLLKGLNALRSNKISEEFWKSGIENLYPWTFKLLSYLKKQKFEIHLISASTDLIIKPVSKLLGITRIFTSEHEVKSNMYTGGISKILDSANKNLVLKQIIQKLPDNSFKVGVGDSTGDVGLLSLTDESFVVNVHEEKMRDIANRNNWHLVSGGEEIISLLKSLKHKYS